MSEAVKNRSIAAQVAAKAAAEIFSGVIVPPEQVTGMIEAIYNKVTELAPIPDQPAEQRQVAQIPVQQVVTPQQGVQNAMQAFPGAQVVPQAPIQGIHAGSKVDELWANVLSNPQDWYNNTGEQGVSLHGGKKPDFRHKQLKKPDGNSVSLWLNGKFGPAPDWVWQGLNIAKPVTQVQQGQAVVAAAPPPQGAPQVPQPDQVPY